MAITVPIKLFLAPFDSNHVYLFGCHSLKRIKVTLLKKELDLYIIFYIIRFINY